MKRTPIKRKGRKALEWEAFRNAYAEECRGVDGLIQTSTGREVSPDLHHIIGRNDRPDLYFSKSNLIWLNRNHHNEVHSGAKDTRRTSIKGQQPPISEVWQPTSLYKIRQSSRLRGSGAVATKKPGKTP